MDVKSSPFVHLGRFIQRRFKPMKNSHTNARMNPKARFWCVVLVLLNLKKRLKCNLCLSRIFQACTFPWHHIQLARKMKIGRNSFIVATALFEYEGFPSPGKRLCYIWKSALEGLSRFSVSSGCCKHFHKAHTTKTFSMIKRTENSFAEIKIFSFGPL